MAAARAQWALAAASCALLLLILAQTHVRVRPATALTRQPGRRAAECAAAYEACGAVPAPVGHTRCCDEGFFCFTKPPYFSQCRPRCAAVGSRCRVSPCCAGAVCGEDKICAKQKAAWYAIASWPGVRRRAGSERARAMVMRFERVLAGRADEVKGVVAAIAPGMTARLRVGLRNRVWRALRDPVAQVEHGEGRIAVRKDGWGREDLKRAAGVLAGFEEVAGVLPER